MKKLNYFQIHPKKKRKKLPYRKPTIKQMEDLFEYFRSEIEKLNNINK